MRASLVFRALFSLCALSAADATACDLSLIKGPNEVKFNDTTKTLSCRNEEQTARAIEIYTKRYEALVCDEVNGWRAAEMDHFNVWQTEGDKIADASSLLNVNCVDYCILTGPASPAMDVYVTRHLTKHVKCDTPRNRYGLLYDGKIMTDVWCSLTGWKSKTNLITKDVFIPQKFECIPGCKKVELSNGAQSFVANDETGETVFKCDNSSGIRLNEGSVSNGFSTFSEIKCSPGNGYTLPDGTKFAGAYDKVQLTCGFEAPNACTLQPAEGIKYNRFTNALTCAYQYGYSSLNIGSARYTSIICNETEGWKAGDKAIGEGDSPLAVSCVAYCEAEADGEKLTIYDNDGYTYVNCKRGSELIYDGKLLNGTAECSIDGWRDRDGVFRADTATTAKFECREVSTVPTVPTTARPPYKTTPRNSQIELSPAAKEEIPTPVIIGCSVFAVLILLVIVLFIVCLCKTKRSPDDIDSEPNNNGQESGRSHRKTRSEKISNETNSEAPSEL